MPDIGASNRSDGVENEGLEAHAVLDIPYESGDPGVIVTAYVTCPECGEGFLAMADEKVTGCAQHMTPARSIPCMDDCCRDADRCVWACEGRHYVPGADDDH